MERTTDLNQRSLQVRCQSFNKKFQSNTHFSAFRKGNRNPFMLTSNITPNRLRLNSGWSIDNTIYGIEDTIGSKTITKFSAKSHRCHDPWSVSRIKAKSINSRSWVRKESTGTWIWTRASVPDWDEAIILPLPYCHYGLLSNKASLKPISGLSLQFRVRSRLLLQIGKKYTTVSFKLTANLTGS